MNGQTEVWYSSNEGGLYCQACYDEISQVERERWKILPLGDEEPSDISCWDCDKPYPGKAKWQYVNTT